MSMNIAVTDIALHIAELFVRLPMLTGFSVQERACLTRDRAGAPLAGNLCLTDVAVDTWPGFQAGPAVHEEIAQALLELLHEHPESIESLRGQTFARTFH